MSPAPYDRDMAIFFNRFVDAFATFDGKCVASLFMTPGFAVRQDGSLVQFAERGDVATYYQGVLDRYRTEGCMTCRYADLESSIVDDKTLTSTVSWDLLRGDGTVARHWRQTYYLARFDGNWRIFGSKFVPQ